MSKLATNQKAVSRLTADEIVMVQRSWNMIKDVDELIVDFYNHLFYTHPELRPFFRENLRPQGYRFYWIIEQNVRSLPYKNIESVAEEIDRIHSSYYFENRHFVYLENAFLYALKNSLGPTWNNLMANAWMKLYRTAIRRAVKSPF